MGLGLGLDEAAEHRRARRLEDHLWGGDLVRVRVRARVRRPSVGRPNPNPSPNPNPTPSPTPSPNLVGVVGRGGCGVLTQPELRDRVEQ